jgi:hypothetical protein
MSSIQHSTHGTAVWGLSAERTIESEGQHTHNAEADADADAPSALCCSAQHLKEVLAAVTLPCFAVIFGGSSMAFVA